MTGLGDGSSKLLGYNFPSLIMVMLGEAFGHPIDLPRDGQYGYQQRFIGRRINRMCCATAVGYSWLETIGFIEDQIHQVGLKIGAISRHAP